MNDLPGYRAAQAAYDNMTPPEDGPSECPECNGSGYEPATEDHENEDMCQACEGCGWLDENGVPFNQSDDEHEACEAADRKRDEGLTA